MATAHNLDRPYLFIGIIVTIRAHSAYLSCSPILWI